MSTQDILIYAGFVLIAIAVVLGAGAAFLFFTRNIPDIIDDLSGKKRSEAIAQMAEPGTGMLRRNAKPKSSTPAAQPAAMVPSTGELRAAAAVQPAAQPEPIAKAEEQPAAASNVSYSYIPQAEDEVDVTTVMSDEEPESGPRAESEPEPEPEPIEEVPVVGEAAPSQEAIEEGDSATTQDAEPTVDTPSNAMQQTPEWFHIVESIVLTDSTEYVRVEQGEGHA